MSKINKLSIIDHDNINILIQEHEKTLAASLQNIAKQEKYQSEYLSLIESLKTLPNKLRHEALVPLGPLVMAKGKLIHTNEITCHIGDNWFVECSSKTAEKIATHRIQKSMEMLVKYEKEKELITSWISEARRQLTERGSQDTVEITELYNEQEETEWRKKHKENVKKYYQDLSKTKQHQDTTPIQSDQQLWDRLDMLEMEEELQEYENRKKGSTSTKHTSSNSGESVGVKSIFRKSSFSEVKKTNQKSILKEDDEELESFSSLSITEKSESQKRRVSFDASKDTVHSYSPEPLVPPITSPVVECEPRDEITLDAVKNLVIEKVGGGDTTVVGGAGLAENNIPEQEEEPPERVSLFKQRRMKEMEGK